jgi:hypothetical protein
MKLLNLASLPSQRYGLDNASFTCFRPKVCTRQFSQNLRSTGALAKVTGEMQTILYIFTICFAGLFLYVAVNRFEANRPLAILLMILILGVTAAAVLTHLMP